MVLSDRTISRLLADGRIEVRPGDDDPGAIALMHKLSAKSRERWPGFAVDDPRGPAKNGKSDKSGEKTQPVQA